jgi:hypothetical protein
MEGAVGNGIIMVLSPAKTMDLRPLDTRDYAHDDVTPIAISRIKDENNNESCRGLLLCERTISAGIVDAMKGKTEGELKSLLNLSANLAKVARRYWGDFSLDDRDDCSSNSGSGATTAAGSSDYYKPAMFTFSGPAYLGLSPASCDCEALNYLASRLFIIDPVYGVLRSLQGMRPYRLEMGCRPFLPRESANLASRWKRHVSVYLGRELTKISRASSTNCDDNGNEGEIGEEGGGGAILVNLASEEYSSAVDAASLPRGTTYLNVVFRHAGRVVSVHAKRARGCMARYLAEAGARTLRDVSEFDREGYRCAEFANGKMWEEEGEKRGECENDDVKIVRMIFDRPSGAIKSDAAKRAAPVTTKRQGNAAKKTKK